MRQDVLRKALERELVSARKRRPEDVDEIIAALERVGAQGVPGVVRRNAASKRPAGAEKRG